MDDEDFLEAFTENLDRLHNLARGLTRSRQDAEDLISETCLLALRGWRRGAPDDAGAWFATICLNAARSAYRRTAVRPREISAEQWLLDQADSAADTADVALASVQAHRVRMAVAQLPPPQLEAIALMDLAGYTAAQTATIVGAPRGTILARVHRGRKVLARTLAGDREQVSDDT